MRDRDGSSDGKRTKAAEVKVTKAGEKIAASEGRDISTTPAAARVRPAHEAPLLPPAVEVWLRKNGAVLGIGLFLVAATLAVYGQTLGFEFVSFDDNQYVTENRHVKEGLTLDGLGWAFTSGHAANWHPLTWLSHMLDWSLYGDWAGGHHLTSVLLHAAAPSCCFWPCDGSPAPLRAADSWRPCSACTRSTSNQWRGSRAERCLVRAVFRADAVGIRGLCRGGREREQGAGSKTSAAGTTFPWGKYTLVLVLFALGLLCKPMLVTVPFLLLLLDFWPLGRWGENAAPSKGTVHFRRHEIGTSPNQDTHRGKTAVVPLSAASCVATYFVQKAAGAVTETVSPMVRLQTVVLGYARYLAMLVWPFGLALPYPRDREIFYTATVLCGLAVAAISVGVLIWCRRRCRYMLTGWFWFLGMLVPVIGLVVVVGYQSVADRYTYLTYTGLFIALVWGSGRCTGARHREQGAGSR